jgi:hypothetical protein
MTDIKELSTVSSPAIGRVFTRSKLLVDLSALSRCDTSMVSYATAMN